MLPKQYEGAVVVVCLPGMQMMRPVFSGVVVVRCEMAFVYPVGGGVHPETHARPQKVGAVGEEENTGYATHTPIYVGEGGSGFSFWARFIPSPKQILQHQRLFYQTQAMCVVFQPEHCYHTHH